jgi:ornithine carbamoyltransferase
VKKDFLSITDLAQEEILQLFDLARDLKKNQKEGKQVQPLKGKTLAMIFQKPSTRTRISFDVGMYQLGGYAIYMSPSDIGLGKRESVADVARVLSRYNNCIMARLFEHEIILELAQYASIPVINGLTDLLHPCQILGDLLTIIEHRGGLDDLKISYIGDGNNVVHSWINAASKLPMKLHLACPKGYDPDNTIINKALDNKLSEIVIHRNPIDAVKNSDVIYTDVWASMGQEKEAAKRRKVFKNFQITEDLVSEAKQDVLVMHCLPAHRGEEITDKVIEGSHSIVFDEAENRLHIQKAIMVSLMA